MRYLGPLAISLLLVCLAPTGARAQSAVVDEVGEAQPELVARPTESMSAFKGALVDSLRLLLIEHSTRVAFQSKTRRELGGPFLRDYVRSVRWPKTWGDGDSWLVNYVGHPIHGAAASRLWIDHHLHGRDAEIGLSKAYWASRATAFAWAAGYSLQFEFGPLSEAAIGNVGLRPKTTGWVDHVVTPVGALGFTAAEDALDKYFIEFVERKTGNTVFRAIVRVLFNPSRSLANIAQGRLPWARHTRPIR